MKYFPVILAIILAIILVSIYTYLIPPDQLWNWCNGLISTLVSVLLGVSIAFFIFFYQNNVSQSQEKKKYLFLLGTELAATWQALQTVDNPLNINFKEKTYSFHVGFLQAIVLEEAARCGLFNENETRTLLKLSRWINFHNMNLNLLISVIPQIKNDSSTQQKVEMTWTAYTKTRNEIINDIQLANKQFKLAPLKERIHGFPPK